MGFSGAISSKHVDECIKWGINYVLTLSENVSTFALMHNIVQRFKKNKNE